MGFAKIDIIGKSGSSSVIKSQTFQMSSPEQRAIILCWFGCKNPTIITKHQLLLIICLMPYV
jgi:hypothetical protein